MSEEKTLGLSYMASFLEHIKALNSSCSVYSNTLAEIDVLYGGDFNLIPDPAKIQVINQRHAVVNQVNTSYFMYKSISSNNPKHPKGKEAEKEDEKIKGFVDTINKDFIFKRDILFEFTQYLNDYIVKHKFTGLFNVSQTMVNSLS